MSFQGKQVKKSWVHAVILFIALSATSACRQAAVVNENSHNNRADAPTGYAKRFIIENTDSCTILSVLDPWQGSSRHRTDFYLVREGNHQNSGFPPERTIIIPVRRLVCTSTTHIAMITALGEESAICGFSGTRYIYDNNILRMVEEGLISEIGYDSGLDFEQIVRLRPDLMMVYGISGENTGIDSKLKELGIKVIYNADYLEDDPLAKAEWIKVFGALFGKQEEAERIFGEITTAYEALKDSIAGTVSERPKVLLGLPFRDSWFISSGNSYISRLIYDAGGSYLWSDIQTDISLPFGIESVWIRARDADFWLNAGSADTSEEIRSIDQRLASLSCFVKGNIFNNNKRMSPGGGNDYWESGILKPHIILMDIAGILHPELFDDYESFYYKKIGIESR